MGFLNKLSNAVFGLDRRMENGRLVYYREKASPEFWDQVWKDKIKREFYEDAVKGYLDDYEEPFSKYFKKGRKILEAGCGLGTIVLTMCTRGYDCEGVEWASETVKEVKKLFPDLSIRCGDVQNMDVPDGYYQGYISLGVIEHRKEGPEPFLIEANRILADDGIAVITVPYIHPLRKWRGRLGFYRVRKHKTEFYQYAFSKEEIVGILNNCGFDVIESRPSGVLKAMSDDVPFLSQILRIPRLGKLIRKSILSWGWAKRNMGHMILFVCRKV